MTDYAPIFHITPEILTLVYEIATDLAEFELISKSVLTPKVRKINRIKTIQSSLWIEANTLTVEQVTDILNGKKVIAPEKDILEAKNAIIAYDKLLDCDPYSEDDLLRLHKLMMNGLIDNAGKYRNASVGVFSGGVPIHIAPSHQRVPELMKDLLLWTKESNLPQVVKSCIFHYEFEFIHPFSDGNGRMGRMWQTLLLCQENRHFAWLPVESIVADNQQEYYRAIRQSTHHNDSGIFALFMLTAIKQAVEMHKEKKKQHSEYVNEYVNDYVNAEVKLPKIQMRILSLIAKNNNISQGEIAQKLKIGKATVFRHIDKMKQINILSRQGSDKTGHWMITTPTTPQERK